MFSEDLIKKDVFNMFHLHITKVQQTEKKWITNFLPYRKYSIILGVWLCFSA